MGGSLQSRDAVGSPLLMSDEVFGPDCPAYLWLTVALEISIKMVSENVKIRHA